MSTKEIENKIKLIPTDFPTEEERQFWATFNQVMPQIAELMPTAIYWMDLSYRVIYVTDNGLNTICAPASKVIGQTTYNYYPEEVADALNKTAKNVIETQKRFIGEHITSNYETDELAYWEASIDPIFNFKTGNLMGLFGISTDITQRKKADALHASHENRTNQLVDAMHQLMAEYRLSLLHDRIGVAQPIEIVPHNIKLSQREKEVLYYLSCNKAPKEITQILSTNQKKEISHYTIHSIINKQLYTKFEVTTTNKLLEKAARYGLIPLYLNK